VAKGANPQNEISFLKNRGLFYIQISKYIIYLDIITINHFAFWGLAPFATEWRKGAG